MTHDTLCYRSHDQTLGNDPFCQCAALRACEQRVFAFHPEWTADICEPDCAACRRLTELTTSWINERQDGYQEGLDAAREAVVVLCWRKQYEGFVSTVDPQRVLAAIDALRKEPND